MLFILGFVIGIVIMFVRAMHNVDKPAVVARTAPAPRTRHNRVRRPRIRVPHFNIPFM